MRKVTKDVCSAFLAGRSKTNSNTSTDGQTLKLHGNVIAERTENGIRVTLAGWPTVTTRERLNGLCNLLGYGRPFHQQRHEQYYNSQLIDSRDWIVLAN